MARIQRDDLAPWIRRNSEPGDLLLTGATDGISQLIQKVLQCRFSHSGVVIPHAGSGPDVVMEMYDYSFLRRNVFEGVWRTDVEKVVDRGGRYLTDISILRPDSGLDRQRLPAAADHVESHVPVFPTVAALMLGALVVAERAGATRLGDYVARTKRVERLIERWIDAGGDGLVSATCAEFAFGLYQAAGFTITVDKPVLGASMNRLLDANGDVTFGEVLTLKGTSFVDVSPVFDSLDRGKAFATPTNKAETVAEGIAELIMSSRQSWEARHETTLLDLMCPADFLNSPQFAVVSTARRRWGRWQTE